ncbi:polysaccharide deacetylase family protein [Paraburkholderia youngii]|uniref:polysaccharide deacetylase family protein n=1 Tax=Paraburkholderia youngii TaxID=2782701 RepID=UPI003D1BC4E3
MSDSMRTVIVTVNVHGVGPQAAAVAGDDLFGRFGHGRYTYYLGLARLLDTLQDNGIAATFFWPICEVERCGTLFDRCLADGHEIAAHGNAFEDHLLLGERETEVLGRMHERLTALTGTAPRGFRAPTGTLTFNTIRCLRALGYAYDSSSFDDDAPYSLADDGGEGMVELPYSEGLCDATHFRRRFTQRRAELAMQEEFDALIEVEGYACLTLHPRGDIGVGRHARLAMLQRLLDRMRDGGVQFRRAADLAADIMVNGNAVWNGNPR